MHIPLLRPYNLGHNVNFRKSADAEKCGLQDRKTIFFLEILL